MLRNLTSMILAFAVGALLMIGLRGTGSGHAEASDAHAAGGHDHGAQSAAPAPDPASHAMPNHTGHAAEPAQPAASAPAEVAQAAPAAAPPTPAAAPAATGSVKLWVCAQDDSYALSWAGDCPLDGKPMVEKTVDASTLKDVKNERCPIMGGKVQQDVYAVYKGSLVRFCCKGCDAKFFASPEEHLKALTAPK